MGNISFDINGLVLMLVLGLRHGLDPDHIAVIDGMTLRHYKERKRKRSSIHICVYTCGSVYFDSNLLLKLKLFSVYLFSQRKLFVTNICSNVDGYFRSKTSSAFSSPTNRSTAWTLTRNYSPFERQRKL